VTPINSADAFQHLKAACFPTSEGRGGKAPSIAQWAERWPQDYLEAKSRAEKSLEKIESAIEAIQRDLQIEGSIALEMYSERSAGRSVSL
jgi:hypothetical protein